MFSDWRNIKEVDYSTNAMVANWYSGGHSQYFRDPQLKEIIHKVNGGDTITVGLDYYYLTRLSPHFNSDILGSNSLRLANGEVITIMIYKKNKIISYLEYRN